MIPQYLEILNRIIDAGILACQNDYNAESQSMLLEGSIDGFKACRNLEAVDLVSLLQTSNKYMTEAYTQQNENYWYFVGYRNEIDWVINVMSAVFINFGIEPILPNLPTSRGFICAAKIVNNINNINTWRNNYSQ